MDDLLEAIAHEIPNNFKALALDGPLNAVYADVDTAHANGYVLDQWPSGEYVWIHESYEVPA